MPYVYNKQSFLMISFLLFSSWLPIEMGGQIFWIDCADEEQVPKSDKNNLVLDFP